MQIVRRSLGSANTHTYTYKSVHKLCRLVVLLCAHISRRLYSRRCQTIADVRIHTHKNNFRFVSFFRNGAYDRGTIDCSVCVCVYESLAFRAHVYLAHTAAAHMWVKDIERTERMPAHMCDT